MIFKLREIDRDLRERFGDWADRVRANWADPPVKDEGWRQEGKTAP